jgi:hypothetical protein
MSGRVVHLPAQGLGDGNAIETNAPVVLSSPSVKEVATELTDFDVNARPACPARRTDRLDE